MGTRLSQKLNGHGSVALKTVEHKFAEFWLRSKEMFSTKFFQSHWLLAHITLVERLVLMTVINPLKEIGCVQYPTS